jgi:hypothetical protein
MPSKFITKEYSLNSWQFYECHTLNAFEVSAEFDIAELGYNVIEGTE